MAGRRLLVGAIGVAGAVLVALVTEGHTLDFGFDWLTARAVVMGIDPYQPVDQLAAQFGASVGSSAGVIHPRTPGVLLIQAPVGWVPMSFGYQVGRVLTVLSFAGLMWVLSELSRVRLEWLLLAMPVLLFVFPFSEVLDFSQTGFLVAALIGWTWLLVSREDSFLAGMPLAVAVCFKVWPWLVVPALWLAGYRKTAVGAVGGFLGLNLLGLALPHVTLSGAVTSLSEAQVLSSWSIWTGIPAWIPGVVGLGAVAIICRLASPRSAVMWSIVVALGVAPILWSHYLVALMVPVVPVSIWVSRLGSGRDASRLLVTADQIEVDLERTAGPEDGVAGNSIDPVFSDPPLSARGKARP